MFPATDFDTDLINQQDIGVLCGRFAELQSRTKILRNNFSKNPIWKIGLEITGLEKDFRKINSLMQIYDHILTNCI